MKPILLIALALSAVPRITVAEALRDGPLGPDLPTLVSKSDFATIEPRLAKALAGDLAGDDARVDAMLEDPVRLTGLIQRELIHLCTPQGLASLHAREKGTEFLLEFLRSPEWMESFLGSGSPSVISYDQALETLHLLWLHGKNMDQPVYRRFATAIALEVRAVTNPRRIIDRFHHVQEAHRALLLHAGFDHLDVREMRWTVHLDDNRPNYQFLLDDAQMTPEQYVEAHHLPPYRYCNDFGVNAFTDGYLNPWMHAYRADGSMITRLSGGVCGSTSRYGARIARAHGVLAAVTGQNPPHAAYVVRVGDQWPIGFDLAGPANSNRALKDWDLTGFPTFTGLQEKVYRGGDAHQRSRRLLWVARQKTELSSGSTVRILPNVQYAIYADGVPPLDRALQELPRLKPTVTGKTNRIRFSDLISKYGNLMDISWSGEHRKRVAIVWEAEIEVTGNSGITITQIGKWATPRIFINGNPVELTAEGQKGVESLIPLSDDGMLYPRDARGSRILHRLELRPGRHRLRLELGCRAHFVLYDVELEGVLNQGDWVRAYERAIEAQPINFGAWQEYLNALEKTPGLPPSVYADLATRITSAFGDHLEAGWALVRRVMDHACKGMSPSERLEFLLDCHRKLRQQDAKYYVPFNVERDLMPSQLKFLGGDSEQAKLLFVNAMAIHFAPPPHDRMFMQIIGWGQDYMRKNPDSAQVFTRAIGEFLTRNGKEVGEDFLLAQVRSGIRQAGAADDLQSYRLWSDLAAAILPPYEPYALNEERLAAFPKRDPFPGTLLSQYAMVSHASPPARPSKWDHPESYNALLSEHPGGGFFWHDRSDNPAAVVRLQGQCELTGLVIVGAYENGGVNKALLPMRVSVSQDGESWIPVADFDTAQPVYRVDLTTALPRASHVKIERLPGKNEVFNLRNILIYGNKQF